MAILNYRHFIDDFNKKLKGLINEPVKAKVYQLKGLYNIIQHHKYRVDYFDIHDHQLSSKYYQDKTQIQTTDWGHQIKANWKFGD